LEEVQVSRTFVYVSNAERREVFVLGMDRDDGALTLVERATVPGANVPSPTSLPMAISPDRRFLYAALRSPPYPASSFAIDASTGRLTHVSAAELVSAMAYIITDRSGRFLLCASYTEGKLAVYPIASAGQIEPQPTQVMTTGPNAHCIVVDAANRFAFAAVLGADVVLQLIFDPASGTLSPNEPPFVATRKRAGPRHLAFHPDGRSLYLINQTDATMNAYRIEPGAGILAEIESIATLPAHFLGDANAADIHATPDGRFLYVSERQTSTLDRLSHRLGERRALADRTLADGDDAARLRHRSARALPAFRRPRFERARRARHRSGEGRAHASRAASDERHAELGRNCRSRLTFRPQ
jgi:6-phosphogluconolactonase